jgi:hypothetical protein
VIIVGIDSEYARRGDKNDVVCVSLALIDTSTGKTHARCRMVADGLDRRCRFTLHGCLVWFLDSAMKNGAIHQPPTKLTLAAHWSRADMPAFRDYSSLKHRLDSPRKTYATTSRPLKLGSLSITLIDTTLLAPSGKRSLAALGELLGMAKRDLPPGAINDMRRFWADHPEEFEAYAIRDAEIAARYVAVTSTYLGQVGALGKGGKLPPTIGSCAVNRFKRTVPAHAAFLGIKVPQVQDHLNFYASCFHGGHNECFWTGYTPRARLCDIDLAGAYTTAMAHIREPAWCRTMPTRARH